VMPSQPAGSHTGATTIAFADLRLAERMRT
jgi:hypothetical protein